MMGYNEKNRVKELNHLKMQMGLKTQAPNLIIDLGRNKQDAYIKLSDNADLVVDPDNFSYQSPSN